MTMVLKPYIYFSRGKDKSIDLDVLDMYKHLSNSIRPQSQITEKNRVSKVILLQFIYVYHDQYLY